VLWTFAGAELSTGGVATATQMPAVGNSCLRRSDGRAACLLSKLIGERYRRALWRRRGLYQPSM